MLGTKFITKLNKPTSHYINSNINSANSLTPKDHYHYLKVSNVTSRIYSKATPTYPKTLYLKLFLSSELKRRSSCLLTTRKWSDLWRTRSLSAHSPALLFSMPFSFCCTNRATALKSQLVSFFSDL
jgi:hypothetical protein